MSDRARHSLLHGWGTRFDTFVADNENTRSNSSRECCATKVKHKADRNRGRDKLHAIVSKGFVIYFLLFTRGQRHSFCSSDINYTPRAADSRLKLHGKAGACHLVPYLWQPKVCSITSSTLRWELIKGTICKRLALTYKRKKNENGRLLLILLILFLMESLFSIIVFIIIPRMINFWNIRLCEYFRRCSFNFCSIINAQLVYAQIMHIFHFIN